MKKILLVISILAALGFASNSCISQMVIEPEEIVPPDTSEVVFKTYYLYFNTKNIENVLNVQTYAYPNLAPSPPIISWGSNEFAGVFMTGEGNVTLYQNRPFYINEDKFAENRKTAILSDTITTEINNATFFGYYPYKSSINGTIISSRLDSVQNQSADKSIRTQMDTVLSHNMFMIAPTTQSISIKEGTGILEFASVFSMLRIQVTRLPAFTAIYAQKVDKVQVYIADKNDLSTPQNYKLAGNYTIDVSRAIGASNYQGPSFSSDENRLTASVTGGNVIEGESSSPYVWFIVNPISIKSNECLVAVVDVGSSRIIAPFEITELKANNVYSFTVVASQLNTITEQPLTVFPSDSASNCYVITRPGICQIPLNTINGLDLRGDTVVWLWASKENGVSNFDIKELIDPVIIYNENPVNVNSNFIRFRVGNDYGKYTKGNVVLALKDKGEIVWTWHIWITDDIKEFPHEGGIMFLDRNIGALSAQMGSSPIDNFGFVYQWGRKDPFFGGNGSRNETVAMSIARENTIVNSGVTWPNPSSSIATAETARKNPMLFICNNTNSTNLNVPVDWLSGSSTPIRWSDINKTDNDPCPLGYKVPGKDDLKIIHNAFSENDDNTMYFRNAGNWHWKYFYYWQSIITEWPTAGMRQGRYFYNGTSGAKLLHSGTTATKGDCYYWTSTPLLAGGIVIPSGSFRIFTSGNLLYSDDEFGDNADAYPIRCVKE